MRKFRILALDGGGIRGLLTARILSRLSNDYGIDNLFDSVDLIAGTSSGGLIALAMAHGLAPEGVPHPPMAVTLRGLEGIFDDAKQTFGPAVPWWLGGTLLWSKYRTAARERAFKKAVGESATLGRLPYHVLVPAFDLDNAGTTDGEPDSRKWKPKLFHNLTGRGSDANALVWKVALYTTALPAYFPTVDGFIDGGVYANNPAMCALAQALDPRYQPRDRERPAIGEIVLLSVGAGQNLKFVEGNALGWGIFRWGVKYVDLTLDGAVGVADFQSGRLLGSERYRRIAPELPPGLRVGPDDLHKVDVLRHFADSIRLDEHVDWLKRHWMEGIAPPASRIFIPPREATSKHVLTSTEITCLAPIREGFVGVLDTRTFATRLRIVIRVLQALRAASRECRALKIVADSVDAIRSIHSFQFAILGEKQLLLAVTFAGAWESYMRIIWRDLGPLMDLILCNCAGYEGHSSDKGFDAFVSYIRSVQIESDFFYPASGLSVDDHRYLAEVEARVRRGGRNLEAQLAGLKVSDPSTTANLLAQLNSSEAIEQENIVLAVLAQLRDLYPRREADHEFLERATRALLRNGVLETRLRSTPPETPEQEWFNEILEKDRSSADELASRSKQVRQREKQDAIQGGILKPHKRRGDGKPVPATHGCLLLARITDPRRARAFLRRWTGGLSVDVPGAAPSGNGPFRNIAFTFRGLKELGVPESELAQFPKEFREGMEARAGLLGDVRSNHPENWVLPEWNVYPPGVQPSGEVPRVRTSTVDFVVQVRIVAEDRTSVAWGSAHPLWDEITTFCSEASRSGVLVLSRQVLHTIRDAAGVRDHFGFVDGISQPSTDPAARDRIGLGELLLGYENDRHDPAFQDGELPGLARRGSLLDNGTFLVIRKLAQHVERLDAMLAANAMAGTPDQIKAKMLGRTVDGKPLVPAGEAQAAANEFTYAKDPHGDACPLTAHIRRANPRSTVTIGGRTVKAPRIVRRGMSYDSALDGDGDARERERGMMFMAYNASIAEQFEVIQRWIAGGNSTGTFSGQRDPLIGVPDPAQPDTFRYRVGPSDADVRRVSLGHDPFVTLRWGLYLFVPSIAALDILTDERPTGVERAQGMAIIETGRSVMQRLQTADDWAAIFEDTTAVHSGLSGAVAAAIRRLHGGVRRTPYGVVVASEPLVMEVLGDDERFSVAEYRRRMASSIGEIYLGLDGGTEYRRKSRKPNAAIQRITAAESFDTAVETTTSVLLNLIGSQQPAPAPFSLEELADQTLARLSTYWLDIPDGVAVLAGGRPAPDETTPRCPMHTVPPSRYIFSSPQPRRPVAELGIHCGRQLLDGVKRFVEQHRDPAARQRLRGELSRALFDAIDDPDELARNLVGVLEGFLPTVFGNFMKVMHLWMSEETLWRLQQDLAAAPEDLPAFERASAALDRPLRVAMMRRPIPDLVHRTATRDTVLGGTAIREGDRIVVSLAAATQDLLAAGHVSVTPVFGGMRQQAAHPTHACPGYDMAMGVLVGMITAVLRAGSLYPGNTQGALKLGDPRPFMVRSSSAGGQPPPSATAYPSPGTTPSQT